MMVSSEKMRATLLEFLKLSPIPLTATELCSQLRVRALKVDEYEVLRELRSLREEGLVRLERGRWNAVSPFTVTSPFDLIPLKLNESNASDATSVSATPVSASATIEWSPSRSSIPYGTPQSDKQPSYAAKPPDFSGPWKTFRKLLGYYADCVRNEEGCEASGFLQDCGERFIFR